MFSFPPVILYWNLRTVVYGGTSVLGTVRQCVCVLRVDASSILFTCGIYLDRRHEDETAKWAPLRGPRIVSRWRFNFEARDFPLTIRWRNEAGSGGRRSLARRLASDFL